MPRIDRQAWANGLYIALMVLWFVAVVALFLVVMFRLEGHFHSGFGAGILLANACIMAGSPQLRGLMRRLRPIFGAAAWNARAALKSGLSLDDYEKSVTTEKTLRLTQGVDLFSRCVGVFCALVAALDLWLAVTRDGSTAWTGVLIAFGMMAVVVATVLLVGLLISHIRRWALGPALVGRAVQP